MDAIKKHEVFQTGRLSEEDRWSEFALRANAESGIESIMSFRLFADGTLGALNLYSTLPDAFDDHDVVGGAVFAAHAAVAWSTSQTEENLRTGMESRQLIGEATGILMARQGVSESEVVDMLRQGSQRSNIELCLMADRIVQAPEDPAPEGPQTGDIWRRRRARHLQG